LYSLKEIFDLAIQMEQAGYDLYVECCRKFSSETYRETFNFLADQEKMHKKKFEDLQKNSVDIRDESHEEYFRYMKSLSGDTVFKKNDLTESLKFIKTPQDALLKGIEDEKSSIFYYNEIKRAYPQDSREAAILEEIIAEERSHILKLSQVHSKLSAL
jgi:rubrerythrin